MEIESLADCLQYAGTVHGTCPDQKHRIDTHGSCDKYCDLWLMLDDYDRCVCKIANRRVLIWSGPLFIRVFCTFLPVEPSPQSIILLIDVVSAVLQLNRIRCVRRPNYLAKERLISSYMPFSTICSRHSKDMSIPTNSCYRALAFLDRPRT